MSKKVVFFDKTNENWKEQTSVHKTFVERSDVAQEIISRKADFFEKWSLYIFLFILLLLFFGTWFIKYPDIIEANAVLTGQNAPKEIIPKQSGKLTALLVDNNQRVTQGQILGWIESTADTKQVIDLALQLDSCIKLLSTGNQGRIHQLFNNRFTALGELQASYQIFSASLLQYNDYLVNGFYSNRKTLLRNDITSLQSMKENVLQQKEFNQKDNDLARKTFEMNELLYKEKVISAEEYRQAQSALLNKQKTDPEIQMNLLAQQNQIRDKQKEIDQLNHDILQQRQTFEQALQTLKSDVDEWLRKYTLRAPTNGSVVFALPLQQNQYVEQGKLLGFVNPEDSRYYAEIKLSQNNFGKIDTGMKVQLRFEAYPYQEIGYISGTLNYISTVAVDSAFLGTIRLDRGLTTNQNKSIQFKNGLKGQALIITKDMRLLERLYYGIVKTTSFNK